MYWSIPPTPALGLRVRAAGRARSSRPPEEGRRCWGLPSTRTPAAALRPAGYAPHEPPPEPLFGITSHQLACNFMAKTSVSGLPPRPVTLRDLIEARLLAPPVRLTAQYFQFRFSATITTNGAISFGGRAYAPKRRGGTALSTVAGIAIGSVKKLPPGKRLVPRDGWLFWHYLDISGQSHSMDELRGDYLVQRQGRRT